MEKKLLERKILKCIWKMSIKDFEKYKYDKCGKNFTHNIGLKGHVFHVENISLNQPVWWFKCVSCGKYITKSASLMIHIKIIHQGQRNHKCDYCGKFYTQMTNLKIHLWLLCPWWIILIRFIRLADLVIYFPHETHL